MDRHIARKPVAVAVLAWLHMSVGHAQVVRDGSIGPGASVQPVGPAFEITESMGESAGANLFHSFSQFSFGAQESVVFSASIAIANIFARVTGGLPSVIGGRLAAPGNLFLINPFGFMFNQTARVDVPGAFHVTTADFIEFETGERFVASPRDTPTLSLAPPSAFGFLSTNPRAPISVQSNLGSSGTPVSLIGGPAMFEGSHVVAVPGDGYSDVTVDRGSDTVRLDRVVIRGGRIKVTGGNVDLRNSALQTVTHDADNAGSVERPGLPVAVDIRSPGTIAIHNTLILSDTGGEGRAGSISIHANVDLVSSESQFVASGTWDGVKRPATTRFGTDPTDYRGDVGSVLLTADRDLVIRASDVINWNTGYALGGTIALSAGRDVRVADGSNLASIGPSHELGPVRVQAGRDVRVSDTFVRSGFRPDGFGSPAVLMRAAGALEINRSFISTRAEPFTALVPSPTGPYLVNDLTIPGPLTLEGRTIDLTDSALDGSELIDPFDTGSTITLNAIDGIRIAGTSIASDGQGKPGTVRITAPQVQIASGSRIQSINVRGNDPGRVFIDASRDLLISDSAIRADGGLFPGNVYLTGGDITLRNSEITSVVARSGTSGQGELPFGVSIIADNFRMEGGSITARSDDAVPAGNIAVTVSHDLTLAGGARLTTTSASGAGGDIAMTVGRLIDAIDSEISTSALGGAGGGGNIQIRMGNGSDVAILILERSQLTARAVEGRGGNMTIVTGVFVPSGDPETVVSASSVLGIAGEVQIDAPDASIVGTLTTLPAVVLDAAGLIRQGCTVQGSGSGARLFVRDRGGMPAAPGGLLPAPATPSVAAPLRAPDYAAAVVGVTADGRPVLLSVNCGR